MEHRSLPHVVAGRYTRVKLTRSPRFPNVVSDSVKPPNEPTGVLPRQFNTNSGMYTTDNAKNVPIPHFRNLKYL